MADHLWTRLGEELGPKTVGIFLARLVEKGYLRSAHPDRPWPDAVVLLHIYQALTREESLRQQFEKFLEDHLIGGASLAFLERLLSQRREQVEAPRAEA